MAVKYLNINTGGLSRYNNYLTDVVRDIQIETNETLKVIELTKLSNYPSLHPETFKSLLAHKEVLIETFYQIFNEVGINCSNFKVTRVVVGHASAAKVTKADFFINFHCKNTETGETHFFFTYLINTALY